MTADEWLAANLAAAPPLTPVQIAEIGRVFRPVLHTYPADELPPQEHPEPR